MTELLITGGSGFLGRHVVNEFRSRGVERIETPRRSEYDLTDQRAVNEMFERFAPEHVVHLAAEVGGIGANRSHPGRYFYANAMMGINLIEVGRQHGVEKFVQVGTVCSYPKLTPVPFSETELWNGFPEETNAPYGVAKRSLLVMLQAYRRQYGLNGIYLMPANLYGPFDNFDLETSHVIPALIRRFVSARNESNPSVTLWGTGSPSREFLHVRDAARGVAMATEAYDDPEPINLGTGQETRISDLASLIARLTGYEGEIVWDEDKPDGQPRRSLDITRASERLGFSSEIPLEQGLRETIDWWENQPA